MSRPLNNLLFIAEGDTLQGQATVVHGLSTPILGVSMVTSSLAIQHRLLRTSSQRTRFLTTSKPDSVHRHCCPYNQLLAQLKRALSDLQSQQHAMPLHRISLLQVESLSRCTMFWKRLLTPNCPTLYHFGDKPN